MPDEYHALLHYTEPMLRRAVRVYIWRRVLGRPKLLLTALLLLGVGVAAETSGWSPFIAGLALACLVFLAVFVAVVWRAHFTNTIGRFRAMDPQSAKAVFGPASMTVSSNRGSSTIPWPSFSEYWELDEVWLLFLAPSQFLTLPIDALTPELQKFLRSKLTNGPH